MIECEDGVLVPWLVVDIRVESSTLWLLLKEMDVEYLLDKRVGPLRLQLLASCSIISRVVAWRSDGNGSHELSTDGRVELCPSALRRPACITRQATAVILCLWTLRQGFDAVKQDGSNEARSKMELHDGGTNDLKAATNVVNMLVTALYIHGIVAWVFTLLDDSGNATISAVNASSASAFYCRLQDRSDPRR
jgi:hypothetical protein